MSCPACAFDDELEFPAEGILHPRGIKNLGNPGVVVFPKLLACLNCGFSRFSVPKTELKLLAAATPPSDLLTMAAEG
jgi:hypothetical protein